MKTLFSRFSFALLVLVLLSGCVWNEQVESSQAGIISIAGKIDRCVSPGLVSDGSFYSDLKTVSISTLTFSVEDAELATDDNQLLGLKITIQAKRQNDCASITNIFTNWASLTVDQVLIDTISATARESMKTGVRSFTLEQLLDDRNGLSLAITESLATDAAKYSAQIVNVTIENVAIDPEYADVLSQKALITAQIDQAVRQQDLIRQTAANEILQEEQRQLALTAQLEAEKAETDIQIEIARRAGEVIAAKNEIYSLNPEAFELERLRLIQGILGDNVIYFLQEGTDLSLFLTQPGQTQPIPVSPTE